MPNAKSNIAEWQHKQNLEDLAKLRAIGFEIEFGSQSYTVHYTGNFLHGAGTVNPPHGRYRTANTRDNLASALSAARTHMPDVLKKFEKVVASLAGSCTRGPGHTPQDVTWLLTNLSRWCNLHIVCLWDYHDMWGIGGDSDYAIIKPGKAGLYEAPSEIFDFLWGEGSVSPESLLNIKPGAYLKGSNNYHEEDTHNWYRRTEDEVN